MKILYWTLMVFLGVTQAFALPISNLDSDGDGLADEEEVLFGCDPASWDTDGDGMSDSWEVYADMDPLCYDGDDVSAGDVMAYAIVTGTLVTVWQYGDLASKETYILSDGAAIPQVGDSAQGLALNSKYAYGDVCGMGLQTNAPAGSVVYAIEKNVSIALVHAQVYRKFGFDPLTANPAVAGDLRVNTKPFAALDKYLMVRYFAALGLAIRAIRPTRGGLMCRQTIRRRMLLIRRLSA